MCRMCEIDPERRQTLAMSAGAAFGIAMSISTALEAERKVFAGTDPDARLSTGYPISHVVAAALVPMIRPVIVAAIEDEQDRPDDPAPSAIPVFYVSCWLKMLIAAGILSAGPGETVSLAFTDSTGAERDDVQPDIRWAGQVAAAYGNGDGAEWIDVFATRVSGRHPEEVTVSLAQMVATYALTFRAATGMVPGVDPESMTRHEVLDIVVPDDARQLDDEAAAVERTLREAAAAGLVELSEDEDGTTVVSMTDAGRAHVEQMGTRPAGPAAERDEQDDVPPSVRYGGVDEEST